MAETSAAELISGFQELLQECLAAYSEGGLVLNHFTQKMEVMAQALMRLHKTGVLSDEQQMAAGRVAQTLEVMAHIFLDAEEFVENDIVAARNAFELTLSTARVDGEFRSGKTSLLSPSLRKLLTPPHRPLESHQDSHQYSTRSSRTKPSLQSHRRPPSLAVPSDSHHSSPSSSDLSSPSPSDDDDSETEDHDDGKKRKKSGGSGENPEQFQPCRVWFVEHLHHPYPTSAEKKWLAERSKVTRNSINLWFTNMRRRSQWTLVARTHASNNNDLMTSLVHSYRSYQSSIHRARKFSDPTPSLEHFAGLTRDFVDAIEGVERYALDKQGSKISPWLEDVLDEGAIFQGAAGGDGDGDGERFEEIEDEDEEQEEQEIDNHVPQFQPFVAIVQKTKPSLLLSDVNHQSNSSLQLMAPESSIAPSSPMQKTRREVSRSSSDSASASTAEPPSPSSEEERVSVEGSIDEGSSSILPKYSPHLPHQLHHLGYQNIPSHSRTFFEAPPSADQHVQLFSFPAATKMATESLVHPTALRPLQHLPHGRVYSQADIHALPLGHSYPVRERKRRPSSSFNCNTGRKKARKTSHRSKHSQLVPSPSAVATGYYDAPTVSASAHPISEANYYYPEYHSIGQPVRSISGESRISSSQGHQPQGEVVRTYHTSQIYYSSAPQGQYEEPQHHYQGYYAYPPPPHQLQYYEHRQQQEQGVAQYRAASPSSYAEQQHAQIYGFVDVPGASDGRNHDGESKATRLARLRKEIEAVEAEAE